MYVMSILPGEIDDCFDHRRSSSHTHTTSGYTVPDSKRQGIADDVEQLLKAGESLRDAVESHAVGLRTLLAHLDSGISIGALLEAADARTNRQLVTDNLREFEACRHQLHLSLAMAGMGENMTISEIGRAFGVSRQLTSRIVKEARSQVR
jgi:hypothetical protein